MFLLALWTPGPNTSAEPSYHLPFIWSRSLIPKLISHWKGGQDTRRIESGIRMAIVVTASGLPFFLLTTYNHTWPSNSTVDISPPQWSLCLSFWGVRTMWKKDEEEGLQFTSLESLYKPNINSCLWPDRWVLKEGEGNKWLKWRPKRSLNGWVRKGRVSEPQWLNRLSVPVLMASLQGWLPGLSKTLQMLL